MSHRLGTLTVDLDLNPKRYMRGQQTIRKEAEKGAKVLEKNFHNLGLKSDAMYDLMRAQAQKSFEAIRKSGKATANDLINAERAKAQKIKQINAEQFGKQTSILAAFKKNWLATTAAMYGAWRLVNKGLEETQAIFTAGMQSAQMKKAFSEIAGGAQLAEREIQFLRDTSDKLGQNFWELQDSFKGLLAASKGSVIEGEKTREVFEAITRASATLGLSAEKTKMSIYAVQQMMSKGTVTAEELKRQLGDNLPGAFVTAAKAMDMNTKEMMKAMEQGEIMAADFLPKFAKALKEKYSGEVVESIRATNKWNEALMDMKVTIADSGFLEKMVGILKNMTEAISDPEFQDSMSSLVNDLADIASNVAARDNLENIVSSISKLVKIYQSLPDGVIGAAGAGVIGRILTGSTPMGQAAATLVLLNAQLKEVGLNLSSLPKKYASLGENVRNLWKALIGEVDWDTGYANLGTAMDPDAMSGTLDFLDTTKKEIQKIRDELLAWGEANGELSKEVKNLIKEYEGVKHAFLMESYEYEVEYINKTYDKYKAVAKDKELLELMRTSALQDALDKRVAAEEKANKEIEDKARTLYKHLINMSTPDISPADDLFGGYADPEMAANIAKVSAELEYGKGVIDDINKALEDQSELFESSIFGDAASENIQNVAVTFGKLVKTYDEIAKKEERLNDLREEAAKISDPEEQAKAFKMLKTVETRYADESLEAQLSGYRELFHTTSQLFDEHTAAREALHIAEMTFAAAEIAIEMKKALVQAISATTAQGSIPVAGFAMVAAMAAMMASLLAQIGVSMGAVSGGAPSSYEGGTYFEDQSGAWQTESFQDVYDMLEEYDVKQYDALIDIYYEIRELNSNLTNLLVSMLKGEGAVSFEGGAFEPSKYKEIFGQWVSDTFTKTTAMLGDPIVYFISDVVGSFLNDVVDYIFGGSERTELLTVGIAQREESQGTARTWADIYSGEQVPLSFFAWLEEITEGGLFSDDSSRRYVEVENMSDEFLNKLSKVFYSIIDSMMSLADIYGFTEEQINQLLAQGLDIPLLQDLDKMSGDELSEALENWFTDIADDLAETWFGELIKAYQKADEGMYEAAVRIAMEMVMVQEAITMTGNVVDTTTEGWIELSQTMIDAAGSLDDLMEAVDTYFNEFLTEAEQFSYLSRSLASAFEALDQTLPETRQGFKDLINSLDLTTEEGQELYVALLDLAGATDLYYDSVESATEKIIDAQRALSGTEDSGTISDIADRYGINANDITIDYVGNLIDQFLKHGADAIRKYAEDMGWDAEQLADDIMWLAEYFGYLADSVNDAGDAAGMAAWRFGELAQSIIGILDGIQSQIDYKDESASAIKSQFGGIQAAIDAAIAAGDFETAMDQLYLGAETVERWYNAAVAEATEAAQEAARAERDALNEQRDLLNEQLQVARSFGSLVDTIKSTITSIESGSLNTALPTEKAAFSENKYTELRDIALASGDVGDYQEFVGYAQTALQLYQDRYKSSQTYQGFYDMVMGDLEAAQGAAEAQSYDEAILAELEAIDEALSNIEVTVDLSAINTEFARLRSGIEAYIDRIQTLDMIVNINWEDFTGDKADALQALLTLVDEYGWESTFVIEFLNEVPLTIFDDINDLAAAAKWVAKESGGWESKATLSFLKNVAANWEFEDLNEILSSIGWVKEQAGSWTSQAVITFMAELMDRYDQPIDAIDDWLTALGIVDADIRRTMTVTLIYEMIQEGTTSFEQVAAYVHNLGTLAATAADAAEALPLLRTMEAIGSLWNIRSALLLGQNVAAYGVNTDYTHWPQLWEMWNQPTSWAEGGVVNQPTLGWVGEAGYPEAVIPMMDGTNIPVKWLNGGSTGAENSEPKTINLTVNVGGREFKGEVKAWADETIRMRAERGQLHETRRRS